MYQFKAKDSELIDYPLCLVNIWKYFSDDNMKQTGLNRKVFGFQSIILVLLLIIFWIFINI